MEALKRVSFCNLGCKVNSYEIQAMQALFEKSGYQVVEFNDCADLYIVNTCTVTNIADRKSRQMLHKAKKTNPDSIVVAVGCYAQADGAKLENDDKVDIIIGNNHKHEIVQMIESYMADHQIMSHITNMREEQEYEPLALESISDRTRATIKIQDGCNQYCSYCIIPYVRGPIRSRNEEDIVQEVEKLIKKGYKEIVLTGIHLSSYGKDLNKQYNCSQNDQSLLSLMERLNHVQGIERIRLGSLEPRIITKEFIHGLLNMEHFCPHFHLSLQSGSDGVLTRMNRRYTCEEYYEKCKLIREYFTEAAITTDIIVGFPGETEDEFNETKLFVEKVRFSSIHIFKYSQRKGTKAADMKEQIPEKIKSQRSNELMNIEKTLKESYYKRFILQNVEVLMEEEIELNGIKYYIGYSKNYIKIAIPQKSIKLESNVINKIIEVKIIGFLNDEIVSDKISNDKMGYSNELEGYLFI